MRSVPKGGSVGSYSPRTYSEGNEVAAVQRKSQLPSPTRRYRVTVLTSFHWSFLCRSLDRSGEVS
jgi:hypothetical protein